MTEENNASNIQVVSNEILDNSIKKVYNDFKNNNRNIDISKKWIYKFTLLSQLSYYLIPQFVLFILYEIFNKFIKKEDKLGLRSFVIINALFIVGLNVYSNYLSPPELQYDYI